MSNRKMAVLRGGQEEKYKTYSREGDQIRLKRLRLGSSAYSNSPIQKHESFPEMLLRLKRVAIDPCNPRASSAVSVKQPWSQILKARKVLFLSTTEFPWKKRNLHQFLQGTPTATSDSASKKANEQSFTGLSSEQCSFASSVPCLLNRADSTESFNQPILQNPCSSVRLSKYGDYLRGKQVSTDPSFQDDALNWTNPLNKELPPLVDSDESVKGSNSMSPEKPILPNPSLFAFDDSVNSSNPSNTKRPKRLNLQTSRRSIRLLNFIGDYLPRMAIPIGPRFQADVPDWPGTPTKENRYCCDGESDNSKWLGTRIWPIKNGTTETIREVTGKGRPDSCSCVSPGSPECIKHHITEERLWLQSHLGPAFLSWKFDEMGEEVSKLWTFKEQKTFKSLVKMNPRSRGKSFWKHALNCFPSKNKESIVSYYLNVFVPRRMSMQTRSASEIIDSDDDNADDTLNCMDSRKRCRAENVGIVSYKYVKTRYLIRRG